jgi:peroxiredoxin
MSVILIQQRLFSGDTAFIALRDAYKKLDPKLKETRIGKQVEERLKAIENTRLNKQKETTTPAVKAQDFSAKNPEGKTISLKQSMGKVTLIDFWASWCPPCRKENPNVVKMYEALQPKGLAILGVSLDTSAEAWKKAIAQDGLTWTQVSNLKGWKDPIAVQYKVEEIPTTLVLDAQGTIVARGLTGEALRSKIESLLR